MQLLYLHNQYISPQEKGGLNTTLLQVFSMCNAFCRAGYQVTLAMGKDKLAEENLDNFINNSFNDDILFDVLYWKKAHSNRLVNRIITKNRIINIAKVKKPTLIITREPYILDGLIKLNVPIVFESHNYKLHNRINLFDKYLKIKIIKTSKSLNFKCLFSISSALMHYWEQKGVTRDKLFSWHDGFDTSLFKDYLNKKEARALVNLPKEKTIVTYTGGLYKNRRIDNIILLAKKFSDIYFIIIGGPERNRQYYEKMAIENNVKNIHFYGFVKHKLIPQYLYASDVLLAIWSSGVPTINYCSPLKLFEYMAAGRVILSHDFPTIKEVLTDSEDAILCEPENFELLCLRLSEAIGSSKDNVLGERARAKAFKEYSWAIRTKRLLEFLSV